MRLCAPYLLLMLDLIRAVLASQDYPTDMPLSGRGLLRNRDRRMKVYMSRLNNVQILPSDQLEGTTHFADLLVEDERLHVPYDQKDQVAKIHLDKSRIGRYLEILALEESPATISLDQSRIRSYIQELASTTQGPRGQLVYRPRIKLIKEALGTARSEEGGGEPLRLQREVKTNCRSESEDGISQPARNIEDEIQGGIVSPLSYEDNYPIYDKENLSHQKFKIYDDYDLQLHGDGESEEENEKVESILGDIKNIDEYRNINDLSPQELTEVDASSSITEVNKNSKFPQELDLLNDSSISIQFNSNIPMAYHTDNREINNNNGTALTSNNSEIEQVQTKEGYSNRSEMPLKNSENIINIPTSVTQLGNNNHLQNDNTYKNSENNIKIKPNLNITLQRNLPNISESGNKIQGQINSDILNNGKLDTPNTLKATHENKIENNDTNIITTFPLEYNTSQINNEKYMNTNISNDKGQSKNEFNCNKNVPAQNNGSNIDQIKKYDDPVFNSIPVTSINGSNISTTSFNKSLPSKSNVGVENKSIQIEPKNENHENHNQQQQTPKHLFFQTDGSTANNSSNQKFPSNESQNTQNLTLNDEEKRLLQDVIPNINVITSTIIPNDQFTNPFNTKPNILNSLSSGISRKPDKFQSKDSDGADHTNLKVLENVQTNSEMQTTICSDIPNNSIPNISSVALSNVFNNVIDQMGINMKKILEDPFPEKSSINFHILGPNISENFLNEQTSITSPTENIFPSVKSELAQDGIATKNSYTTLETKHKNDFEISATPLRQSTYLSKDNGDRIPMQSKEKNKEEFRNQTNLGSNNKNSVNINNVSPKLKEGEVKAVDYELEQPPSTNKSSAIKSFQKNENYSSLKNEYSISENEKKYYQDIDLINNIEDANCNIKKSDISPFNRSPNNINFIIPTKPPEMFDSYYDTVRNEILKHKNPETPKIDGTNKHELYNIINQNLNNVITDKSSLYKMIGRAIENVENDNYLNKNFMPKWLEDRYKELELSSHVGEAYKEVRKETEDESNPGPIYPVAMMKMMTHELAGNRIGQSQETKTYKDKKPNVDEAVCIQNLQRKT